MDNWLQGIISGTIFGLIAVAMMLPMKFEDKKAALLGAFISRFAIGFVIAVAVLPIPPALKGVFLGLLMSLPDAIVTKTYVPILIVGILGGAIIGIIVG